MSTVRFRIPEADKSAASDTFAGIPQGAKQDLARGFHVLASLNTNLYEYLIGQVKESFTVPRRPVKEDEVASKLNIPPQDTRPLMTIVGMTSFVLSTSATSPEDFIEAGIKAGVINDTDRDGVARFTQIVTKYTDEINRAVQVSRLSTSSLPILDDFEISIDLRLSYNKEILGAILPVALIRISTDVEDRNLIFQLTRYELEKMIEDLQTALGNLEQAEKWANTQSPKR